MNKSLLRAGRGLLSGSACRLRVTRGGFCTSAENIDKSTTSTFIKPSHKTKSYDRKDNKPTVGSETPYSDLKSEFQGITDILNIPSQFQDRKDEFEALFNKYGTTLNAFTIEDMIVNRLHFGHHASQLEPEAKNFVFGERDGVHIIDLEKTFVLLRRAMNVVRHIAYRGGVILFMSNRPEQVVPVRQTAHYSGEYFISEDWKVATFSNRRRILQQDTLPDLIIFTAITASQNAVHEARLCSIPSIGITDTDVHPGQVIYPIPANDDSIDSVNFILKHLSLAIYEGKFLRENKLPLQ